MPIHYVAGEIMQNEFNASAFAIPANCEGVMNLQTTVPFRERYPDLYLDFQRLCDDEESAFSIGDVYLYRTRDNVAIFNVALYRNRFLVMAGHRTVEDAFRLLRTQAEETGITSIAMPPLGGGTGYLDWTRTRRSLERIFRDWEGDLYVYVKPTMRDDMRHWDEEEIDEEAPVTIPRGWKPAMTLYRPKDSSAKKGGESNSNRRSSRNSSRSSSRGSSRNSSRNRSQPRNDTATTTEPTPETSNKSASDGKTEENNSNKRNRNRRGRRGGRNRRKSNNNNTPNNKTEGGDKG